MSLPSSKGDGLRTLGDDDDSYDSASQSKRPRISSQQELGNTDLKELIKKPNTKADIWVHFLVYKHDMAIAVCNHCSAELSCKDGSTNCIRNHHKTCQSKEIAVQKREDMTSVIDNEVNKNRLIKGNQSIIAFLKPAPTFATECTKWIVTTKKSFETVENPYFRKMCLSLNSKAPPLTVRGLKDKIVEQVAVSEAVISKMLRDTPFSITSDGWTSRRMQSYTAITIHWINSRWQLKSCALGCQPKEGPGSAEQHKIDIETALDRFNLNYSNFVASVTDTEATMNSYGNWLEADRRGSVEWIGCVDHLLELTTGLAFEDTELSDNTMRKCRGLVGFFHKSANGTAALLNAQRGMNIQQPLKVKQDVCTRWWSTFQMTERLLKLKAAIEFVQNNSDQLPAAHRLDDDNWKIVKDLVDLLKPFMIAQRLLEGEKYVTLSLIPPIIAKIRRNLQLASVNPSFSAHAKLVSSKMLIDFNLRWGTGLPGTVYNEHKTRAARDR